MLAMPLDENQRVYMPCCVNEICNGCSLASELTDEKAGRDVLCAFCREPTPDEGPHGNKKELAQLRSVDAGDAEAHYALGLMYDFGSHGLLRNPRRAVSLWEKGAKLGSVEAHHNLGCAYYHGDGIEKDMEKALYHYQVAAIGGHYRARHNLGCDEHEEGNMDRSLKQWMISAKMGWEDSLKNIQRMYAEGDATKDDYAQALLGYQDATEEMKSVQRDEANEFDQSEHVHRNPGM